MGNVILRQVFLFISHQAFIITLVLHSHLSSFIIITDGEIDHFETAVVRDSVSRHLYSHKIYYIPLLKSKLFAVM